MAATRKHQRQYGSIAIMLSLWAGVIASAQRPGTVQDLSQNVLNALAMPLAPSSFKTPLPTTYAAWSKEQRDTAPAQIAGRCRIAWTMMNDHGQVPLLPPKQNMEDAPRLAMGVCLLGKMPQDWPGRPRELASVQRMLHESAELGKPLELPASIGR